MVDDVDVLPLFIIYLVYVFLAIASSSYALLRRNMLLKYKIKI